MGKSDEQIEREGRKARGAQIKREAFKPKASTSGIADWAGVDGGLVVRAVAAIGVSGGALRLGYTRDGGAYAVGIYDGDDKQTIYVSPNDSVEEVLREIAEHYED